MSAIKGPPKFALWLLRSILPDNEKHQLIAGIRESYNNKYRESGKPHALIWFWKDLMFSIPHIIKDNFYVNSVMLVNYLKIGFRNLKKHKVNTIVNVTGLSIALSFCILVLLLADNEFSYDDFHADSDKIYSITSTNHFFGETSRGLCYPASPELADNFPEIEEYVRIRFNISGLMSCGSRVFEEYYTLVDKQFFEFFSFPLISGEPETVLQNDNSVVLTRSSAEKYFGRSILHWKN